MLRSTWFRIFELVSRRIRPLTSLFLGRGRRSRPPARGQVDVLPPHSGHFPALLRQGKLFRQ